MKKIKVLLAALVIATMISCQKDVGEYLYVDILGVLHTDKDCLKKNYLKCGNDDLEYMASQGVTYIPTKELPRYRSERGKLCPHCVSDHQTDQIREIYRKHHER